MEGEAAGPAGKALHLRLVDGCARLAFRSAYRLALAWWYVRRPSSRGANVAIWWGDKVLMVRTSYRPQLCFPGGLIEPNEEPIDAAVRELREETGIEIRADELTYAAVVHHVFEYRQDEVHLYEIHVDRPVEAEIDDREIVWTGYLTADECLRHPLFPALRGYLEERSRLR
ncbi:MAG: NUDIX hydrolase [Rhodospirillaceae bacterium]|nr:NUDIX hydrolase [Rhodospirillaceae bacterium]